MSTKGPSESTQGRLTANRLLEAVSPQLTAELDRMLTELRQTVDAEAEVRLKKALLDKEAEFQSQSEEESRRVRVETAQAVRSEVTSELEARFKEQLKAELEGLKHTLEGEAGEAQKRWQQERMELTGEAQRWRILAEFQRRVAHATSQTEMLNQFLDAASQLSDGVAIYLNKPDGLASWTTKGETVFPDLVSEETIDPEWYFTQIVVRSRKVAGVCAAGVVDRDAFDAMIAALKRAIENFGLRIRFFGRGGEDNHDASQESQVTDRGESDGIDPSLEVRRLARMLVSEIKLRNENEVLEGRIHSDLYSRLQKEIDGGRAAYRGQVGEAGVDYFHEQLVKILADNDPERLGDSYPGPAGSAG